MNRLLPFIVLLFYAPFVIGQTELFEEGFENSVTGWTSYGDNTPNYWLANVCAGNGPSNTGQVSMYITFGGASPGCGPGGAINYGYINSDNGIKSAIVAHLVEATCASALQLKYDLQINVDNVNDYGELVYSTNNGATWTAIGGHLPVSATWQTINTPLPASLDHSDFLLGFRFTYDDQTIGFNPLSIDNILVTGTDTEDPVAICPPNQTVYTDASCQAVLGNYVSLASATDNCASGNDFTFTQSPAPGTLISTNTAVLITVADVEGNTGTCSFTALAIDTIDPDISCLVSMTVAVNSACEFPVPDLSSSVTITDNCTAGSNFTITQNPAAGTIASGITNVMITVTDQGGNSSVCGTRIYPDDQVAPVVTCPANVTIDNDVACSYLMTNYIPSVTVVESCPNYTIYQNPPAGATIGTGQHEVVFTVTDEMGNEGTCSFYLDVVENIPPVLTSCPTSISTCNPVVTFAAVTGSDNCGNVLVTQTDASGLSSGSTFPVGITSMEFTVSDSSGNTAVCSFDIEVYEFPGAAQVITEDISLCAVNTTTIAATPVTSGTASWSQVTGTGNIAAPSQASTTVSNLSNGLNTFVWTVETQHCGINRDTVFVHVYQMPTQAQTQTDTTYACSALSSLLLGSFPTVGTPQWTTLQGANIVNPNQHNTVANSLAPGWNDFIYTISSGSCPPTRDTISIYFNNPANVLTPDTSVCREAASFTVHGAEPAFGQAAAWYFIQGQGDIVNPNLSSSEIENAAGGTNRLVYRLSHPVCGFSYDTIVISVNSCGGDKFVFPTVITPNYDGKNDLFVVDNLHELYPECDVTIVNRWGTVVFESKGYKTPWNGTHKNEALPMGTYFFRINLNDPDKTSYSGPISIIR